MSSQEACTDSAEPPAASTKLDPSIWKLCAVVLLGPLMAQLDSTLVNVSLSTIRLDLHASINGAQWIIGGYLLALALTLPLNAWLVERLGAKRLYLCCFSVFTLASVLCGMATSMNQLVAARLLQGAAGGLMAPMAQMMIARAAGEHMARVIGFMAVPVLIAPILGPSVAGAILEYAAWPWLFYINLPVGIVAIVVAAVLLPSDKPYGQRSAFDFVGFLLISPALALVLYGLDHASTRAGGTALVTGLALLAAFVGHANRKKSRALLDLQLFKIKVFAVAATTQLLSNAATFAGQLLVPLYLITGCGFSPVKAGLILAPMGVGMLCAYPSMGYLTDRFGCRAIAAGGALLNLVGTLPLLWMTQAGFSPRLMLVCLVMRGAGQGAIGIPSVSAAYSAVPRERLGQATTTANIIQRVGGPIGTTLLAIVLAAAEQHVPAPTARMFIWPFVALIGLQLLVLISTTRLPRRVHRPA